MISPGELMIMGFLAWVLALQNGWRHVFWIGLLCVASGWLMAAWATLAQLSG